MDIFSKEMLSSFQCRKPASDICFSFRVIAIWKIYIYIFLKQEIYFTTINIQGVRDLMLQF